MAIGQFPRHSSGYPIREESTFIFGCLTLRALTLIDVRWWPLLARTRGSDRLWSRPVVAADRTWPAAVRTAPVGPSAPCGDVRYCAVLGGAADIRRAGAKRSDLMGPRP